MRCCVGADWSMAYDINCNGTIVTDLWHTPAPNGAEGPAFGFNSTCVAHQPAGARDPANNCDGGPRGDHWFGGYEDSLFEQHVIGTIREHDATTGPLYLFWAPHIVHWPGQVPQAYLDKFAFIAPTDQVGAKRQTYHSMVRFADDAVANATAELKAKRMFDDTLIVFSGDNGGWVSKNGTAGGNNYPLAGGKYNNWVNFFSYAVQLFCIHSCLARSLLMQLLPFGWFRCVRGGETYRRLPARLPPRRLCQ